MKIALDVRVAQFPCNASRGIGYYTKNLVDTLLTLDIKNSYLIIGYTGIKKYFNFKHHSNIQIKEMFSPFSPYYYQKVYTHFQSFESKYFDELLKKNKTDLLLTFSSADYNYKIETNNNCKNIRIFLDLIPIVFKNEYLKTKLEINKYVHYLKSFEKSSAIICISNNSKNDLLKYIKFDKNNIHTIYPGISKDFYFIDDVNKLKALKNKYLIKDKYFLYVGGYDFRKNIINLIKGFASIKKELLNNFQLVLCGGIDEGIKNSLLNLAKIMNVDKKIVFIGYLPDSELPTLYSGADLFIFPSLYEGFGLPLIEAMACKCLSIASNNSSLAEISNGNALLFNPLDYKDISNKIEKIVADECLQINFKKRALKYARSFTWDRSASQIINIFNTL